MTRFREGVLAVLLVLLFAWPIPAQETIFFNPPRKATVTIANTNLRIGPGQDYLVISGIKKQGIAVDALAQNGEWVRIRTAEAEAWINIKFLQFEPLAATTTAQDQPATDAVAAAAAAAAAAGDVEAKEDSGEGILVKSIIFEGNNVISSEDLTAAVQDYVGKALTMEEMGELTDQITMVYQENGFILARAYLPEQEIASGVLKIAIAEGRLGKVKVTGKTGYSDRVIKRYFGSQEKLGVIKESALEKGLVLSNEIPKVKTEIVLQQGEKAGEVDMAVNVKDSTFLSFGLDGGIDYNNYGSVYTSENRYGATANIYDHYWGSELKIRGVVGDSVEDSALVTADWRLPLNRYGTRMDAHYITANYLIGEGLEFMGLGGDTEIYGLRIAHPMVTKKNKRFELWGGYQYKHVETEISGELRLDKVHTWHLGFSFDNLDRYLGKNIVFFDYRRGWLEPQEEYDWSDESASSSFSIFKLDLARIQKIYGYTSLLLRGSGQYSSHNLVSSEQMVIGGYGSVRGFEPAIAIGDGGYQLTAELMLPPPFVADKKMFDQRVTQLFQLAAFYDFAQVYVNDPPPGYLHTQHLAGAGLGVRIFYKDRFVFKYDCGFPLNKQDQQEEDVIHYFMTSFNFF